MEKKDLEHTRREVRLEPWRGTCLNYNWKRLSWRKVYQSLCLSLSPCNGLFLCTYLKQYTQFMLWDFEWKVVAIILFYSQTEGVVRVYVNFSLGEVTTRSDWNLRLSSTHVDLLETWWNKCLCGAVVLQGFADNRLFGVVALDEETKLFLKTRKSRDYDYRKC